MRLEDGARRGDQLGNWFSSWGLISPGSALVAMCAHPGPRLDGQVDAAVPWRPWQRRLHLFCKLLFDPRWSCWARLGILCESM